MSLPVQTNTTDPIKAIGDRLVSSSNQVYYQMAAALNSAIAQIGANATAFWALQGTNGAAIMAQFGSWLAFLQGYAPTLVTPAMTGAAGKVTVHDDGTVTVN